MTTLPLILLLFSCNSLPSSLEVDVADYKTDGTGTVSIPVQVSGHRSFLITGISDKFLALEKVISPRDGVVLDWQDWYYEDESLTYAFWSEGKEVFFNWPVRAEDGPLEDGEWKVVLGSLDALGYYSGNAEIEVTTHKNTDGDGLQSGHVKAVIVYADNLRRDRHLHQSMQAAVSHWEDIWADVGITLEVRYKSSGIDTDLDYPGYGDGSQIAEAAAKSDGSEVVVLVGETIDGGMDTYGVSGGIPGTLSETPRSATIISWLTNAGRDGAFDDGEIQLLGETLAHEVGHYFGLFHPVEDGWQYWDALADTPKCTSAADCEDQLGQNLMYPYSICGPQSCTSQYQLTDDQAGVIQRYTGTY